MRYPVPNQNSIKIIDTGKGRAGVAIYNSGPADFFIEILQNNLDGNVDPGSGLPAHGIKVPQNSWPPFILPTFSGVIYARAAVQGALCDVWQYCADC